jgi:Ca2+/H+ antiporter
VVKASITGSIIGNVLLVLGLHSFRRRQTKEQYSTAPGHALVSLCSLAAIGL